MRIINPHRNSNIQMKYYLIAGEASGDLHASHLMKALLRHDPQAEFRFFGGDKMKAVGGTLVRHYKDTAFMGFLPVLMNLRTIFRNMDLCQRDIMEWQPDVVIPVDYAGFNLKIARFLKTHPLPSGRMCKVYYYISPKLWAWKEYRIKNFKRDVDEMFCIMPFEKDFFEGKHNYPVHYVGNPTADEVRNFRAGYTQSYNDFCRENGLDDTKKIVAILPGSRVHEINDNLPAMLKAASQAIGSKASDYQFVIAGVPTISESLYRDIISSVASGGALNGIRYSLLINKTWHTLSHATAALVTSGTATLETACFDVPQVVCYKTILPRIYSWAFRHIIKCDYISLVNLIADSEIVKELFAAQFSVESISSELQSILPGGTKRSKMLDDYKEIHRRLGTMSAPDNCARLIVEKLI